MNSKWDSVNRSLTLIANVGILAGLGLVAYEINQNSELAEATLRNSRFDTSVSIDLGMLGENPAQALAQANTDPSQLTPEQLHVVEAVLVANLNHIFRVKSLGDLGVVDEDAWKAFFPDEQGNLFASRLDRVFNNPAGRAWWRKFNDERYFSDPEVRAAMDRLLTQPMRRDASWYEEFAAEIAAEIDRTKR